MLVAVSENHIKLYRDVEQASCNNLPTGDLGQFVILNLGSSSSFIQARLLCLSSSELIAARKKTNLEEQSLLRSLICSCWVFLKIRSCMFSLKKLKILGQPEGRGKKNVETEFNFWCCLRYRADTQTYQPYNKDWIKEKIYVLLRRQAQQAAQWSFWGGGEWGDQNYFSCLELVLKVLSNLFSEVFDFFFSHLMWGDVFCILLLDLIKFPFK